MCYTDWNNLTILKRFSFVETMAFRPQKQTNLLVGIGSGGQVIFQHHFILLYCIFWLVFKADILNIFILTIYHVTTSCERGRSQCGTHWELSPDSAVPPSYTEIFNVFQLVVLLFLLATLLLWFTLIARIASFLAGSRQLFSVQKSDSS